MELDSDQVDRLLAVLERLTQQLAGVADCVPALRRIATALEANNGKDDADND